jgi:hypothetical protein
MKFLVTVILEISVDISLLVDTSRLIKVPSMLSSMQVVNTAFDEELSSII